MKKIIITIVVIIVALVAIAFKLIDNKAENQAKIDIVAKGIKSIPVKIHQASEELINIDFSSNGKLVANKDINLVSEVNGQVLSVRVEVGDHVRKGQVLATIESAYSGYDLRDAQNALSKLKVDQTRLQNAYENGGVTKSQVDQINLAVKNAEIQVNQAQKRVSDATVVAPFSGIINSRMIETGAFVAAGTPLFNLVDVSSLKLKVSANERQVVKLKEGGKVKVVVPTFQDKTFEGVISFIAPKADNSLNYPLEVAIKNSSEVSLKAGMYATAEFSFDKKEPILVIPRDAFVGSVNGGKIFVIEKRGIATLRKVAVGSVYKDQVSVISNLKVGEKVIVSGQINLIDGSKVEVIK